MTRRPLFYTASGATVELLIPPKDGLAYVLYVDTGAKRWIPSGAIWEPASADHDNPKDTP